MQSPRNQNALILTLRIDHQYVLNGPILYNTMNTCRLIDHYHTAAIFVIFPVYPLTNSPNSHHEKRSDYFSFQPRFGYIDSNGRKTR